jgi:hypothetical protein
MRQGHLRRGHLLNSGIGIVSNPLNESQRLIVDKGKLPSLLQGVINDRNGIPLIRVTGSEVRLARFNRLDARAPQTARRSHW